VGLGAMVAQVFTLPCSKICSPDLRGNLPVSAPEIADRVFIQEAGVADPQQAVQVIVACVCMLGTLRLPGLEEVPARGEFAAVIAVSGRIGAAQLQLAGALHQAVSNPALQDGVVVAVGPGRQVERIAIGDPVFGVDRGITPGDGEAGQDDQQSHAGRIRHGG